MHIQQNVPQYLTRTNSKTSMGDHGEQQHNHDVTVNIQFINNEKLSSSIRKRHENQVRPIILIANRVTKTHPQTTSLNFRLDLN